MRIHYGKSKPGQLRYDVGTMSYGSVTGGERVTERRWIVHRLASALGLSFGSKMFIGIMRFDDTREDRERIK